jgi:hypothetical protein
MKGIVKSPDKFYFCSCCNADNTEVDHFVHGYECFACGADVDAGYICEDCNFFVYEESAVIDGAEAYCTECREECAYCGAVLPRAELSRDCGGDLCCGDCRAEAEAEEEAEEYTVEVA